MWRLLVLASKRYYISKEPIATCVLIADAQTLNGTLIGGCRVGGLCDWRISPAGLSPPRREKTGWTLEPSTLYVDEEIIMNVTRVELKLICFQ